MTTVARSALDVGVEPLSVETGAVITGVDTTADLSGDVVAAVRDALLQYKVVFLRDQHTLDYGSQVVFARRFGALTLGHPTISAPDGRPLLEEIDSALGTRANYWHTDVTFVDRPPALTMLHAKVIPPVGGDTIWANTATAYQSLPAELRDLADHLRVVHTNANDYALARQRPEPSEDSAVVAKRQEFVSTVFETEHPLVRVHPETGERTLVLGGFARNVVGFTPQASRDLIRMLQEYITRPERTVRWRWRVGDLAIWDNRASQHYAIFDYGTAHRRGERVTVAGPVPVGVDGRPSVSLRGDSSAYVAGAA